MLAVVAEIHQDHQDLGAQHAGQNGDDAEVPELVGIESLLASHVQDDHEAADQSQRGHHAIRGEIEIAEVQETWEHTSILDAEATLQGLSGSAAPHSGSKTRVEPQNYGRVGPSGIKNVRREPKLLIQKADEESSLHVQFRLKRLVSLGDQA